MKSSKKQTKLFVGTPCYGGVVTMRYMQSLCMLLLQAPRLDISVQLDLIGHESLITRGRNNLVTKFLDLADTTHLFFIDADIAFDLNQVTRMLAFDQDVVAGMYPLKLMEWNPAAIARVNAGERLEQAALRYVGLPCEGKEAQQRQGFVTAEYAGTGFMMIRRNVLEKMMAAYPETRYTSSHHTSVPSTSGNQYALFDCMIDRESGAYLSEDYTFCKRWRDIGGQIWLDTESTLTHIGAYDFTGDTKVRFAGK
ncbi:MAG TPA: hypothetical protein VHX18_03815 [Rhizomicrobium sp.]|jgi:hypothetical protein|nr:hypothetical protein [Rhizomicrobium sp.]